MAIDERDFIAAVERAGVDELSRLLSRPTREQESALIAHFGENGYARLHKLAVKGSLRGADKKSKGNVVVIHGIMGGELASFDRRAGRDDIWVNIFALLRGYFQRLRLKEDGRAGFDSDYDVRAMGIMKRYYAELLLTLSQNWTVRAFWFDWRKDLKLAAAELDANLSNWFADDEPVHIVAHSMGGLVARYFIKDYGPRWQGMWRDADAKTRGGRLVMLGTPNSGSYVIPQILTGLEPLVRKLARYDFRHSRDEVLEVVRSFAGCYQMLPAPHAVPNAQAELLYQASTYGGSVAQRHLDMARAFHEELHGIVDPERMLYIAGFNRATPSGIADPAKLNTLEGYEVTYLGDGRVSHELGIPKQNGKAIPTYYVDEDHGNLSVNQDVLAALDELLETGSTNSLKTGVRSISQESSQRHAEARLELQLEYEMGEKRTEELVRSLNRNRALSRNPEIILSDERRLSEELTRGYLASESQHIKRSTGKTPKSKPVLAIQLVHGAIEKIDPAGETIDALAVGHYIGLKPVAAERALDVEISRAFMGKTPDASLRDQDLVITQYSERGTIRADLAQFFLLPDPRVKNNGGRTVVIAGMGLPGHFAVPELKVLARELSWVLAKLHKNHLATVVIGGGAGNIPVNQAIPAWISGLRQSLVASTEQRPAHLGGVTFVELDPRIVLEIDQTLVNEQKRLRAQEMLEIEYSPLPPETMDMLRDLSSKAAQRDWEHKRSTYVATNAGQDTLPPRITVALEKNVYRFAAITDTASIPERLTRIDPDVVISANNELAMEDVSPRQLERGQFLESLLIPRDIRNNIYTAAPLVFIVDSTTARIHWEMLAPPDQSNPDAAFAHERSECEPDRAKPRIVDDAFAGRDRYLGTSRGLTRQFRTTFAPLPEPPPPSQRQLRALIVADPAEDAPLPGAEAEGAEIEELLNAFNKLYAATGNRIEVVTLFGPREATRTNVLRELTVRRYDVLHFAGHCVYDENEPESSGWIFTGGKRLTANELTRIDRVPKFVFSNACESGVTPDRPENRSVELAPSFAEAFFARGVSNFVCTAWPVDDVAAREFAVRLYGGLTGVLPKGDGTGAYTKIAPEYMYAAIREARCSVAILPSGVRTWGAYQHYGNPHFRFFEMESL